MHLRSYTNTAALQSCIVTKRAANKCAMSGRTMFSIYSILQPKWTYPTHIINQSINPGVHKVFDGAGMNLISVLDRENLNRTKQNQMLRLWCIHVGDNMQCRLENFGCAVSCSYEPLGHARPKPSIRRPSDISDHIIVGDKLAMCRMDRTYR